MSGHQPLWRYSLLSNSYNWKLGALTLCYFRAVTIKCQVKRSKLIPYTMSLQMGVLKL